MKICDRHWKNFIESLNANLLPLVSIVVSEEMLVYKTDNSLESDMENFKFGLKFDNNPKKFEAEVDKNGGCPICYLGEDFYNRVVERLKRENAIH